MRAGESPGLCDISSASACIRNFPSQYIDGRSGNSITSLALAYCKPHQKCINSILSKPFQLKRTGLSTALKKSKVAEISKNFGINTGLRLRLEKVLQVSRDEGAVQLYTVPHWRDDLIHGFLILISILLQTTALKFKLQLSRG